MIISPLNYPGNKARILKSLFEYLPQNCETFVDVFCGSGIVGLNSGAKKIILNDKQEAIIGLLKFLKSKNVESLLKEIQQIIIKYGLSDSNVKPKGFYKIFKNEGLSRHNKQGFLELRDNYNTNKSPLLLFVLIIFGFNHYLRFNSNGAFNVPVGKMDFVESLELKTREFVEYLSKLNVEFSSLDFRNETLYNQNGFFYFDPPYLITSAPYNATWKEQDELDLLEILDSLNAQGKKFALSNVLISNGKENHLLKEWAKKYRIVAIQRAYTNANYRRKNLSAAKEVLIIND